MLPWTFVCMSLGACGTSSVRGIPGLKGVHVFTLVNNTKLFSKVIALIYTPISSIGELMMLHRLDFVTLIFCLGSGCKVVHHCGYDLHLPNDLMWLNAFSGAYFLTGIHICEVSSQIFYLLFCLFPVLLIYGSSYNLDISLITLYWGLLFCSLNDVFQYTSS